MKEFEKNIITEFIQEAHIVATSSLKTFFKKINIDPEWFSHLYTIPIELGKTSDGAIGQYILEDNKIILNIEDLTYFVNMHKLNPLTVSKNKIILNLALTIVHETLHANRAIIINNKLNARNLNDSLNDELLIANQLKNGHDIEHYNMLLTNILSKSNDEHFKKYIPIKIQTKNNLFSVIAYNQETGNFESFTNLDLPKKDELLFNITELLNKNPKPTETIYNHSFKDEKINYPENYINDNIFRKIDKEKFNNLNERLDIIESELDYQNDFEESFIETLAYIIIMSRNDITLNIEQITKKIENNNVEIYVKMMSKLIRNIDDDLINWYITSSYDDIYENKFYKTFKDNYDDLLYYFSTLYQDRFLETEPNKTIIKDLNELIETINKNKKM